MSETQLRTQEEHKFTHNQKRDKALGFREPIMSNPKGHTNIVPCPPPWAGPIMSKPTASTNFSSHPKPWTVRDKVWAGCAQAGTGPSAPPSPG